MNKYQEALNKIEHGTMQFDYALTDPSQPGMLEEIPIGSAFHTEIDILRGLADKEEPMKPQIIDKPDLHYIYYCPKCGATLMVDRSLHPKHLFNYCGRCGKALDWTGDL
ncbi:MAG: hypothetical protein HF308_19140 [Ignavibacteria bacterium]|jgi:hypothetical protein|nr:hypothetical protein [Ignavibacteria bacterium]MCU7526596.1 hypothetical protein [Ignavibacteria bacterium]